jgi:hypothetical protein
MQNMTRVGCLKKNWHVKNDFLGVFGPRNFFATFLDAVFWVVDRAGGGAWIIVYGVPIGYLVRQLFEIENGQIWAKMKS